MNEEKTPLKPVQLNPNRHCRICRIGFDGGGKSAVNLFGPKSRNEGISKRLAVVVDVKEISPVEGVSENLCQKCYREFLNFEKHLALEKRLSTFKKLYEDSVEQQKQSWHDDARQKRGAKYSPSPRANKKRVRSNDGKQPIRRTLIPQPAAKETVLQQPLPVLISDDLLDQWKQHPDGGERLSPTYVLKAPRFFMKIFIKIFRACCCSKRWIKGDFLWPSLSLFCYFIRAISPTTFPLADGTSGCCRLMGFFCAPRSTYSIQR